MANRFEYQVDVLELKEIHELPGAWTEPGLLELLNLIEYDDADTIPSAELREMTALALSDLEPEDAAARVLHYRFGERLSSGQRKNLAEELKDERLWEEYADISFHEELFNVASMLYWSFPGVFPEPDVIRIQLKATAMNAVSAKNLELPTASFLARLLNDGMDESNTIFRLFDENIASNKFPESEHVIWKFEHTGLNLPDNSNVITIYTSWNWVDELKGVRSFESNAFSDGQLL